MRFFCVPSILALPAPHPYRPGAGLELAGSAFNGAGSLVGVLESQADDGAAGIGAQGQADTLEEACQAPERLPREPPWTVKHLLPTIQDGSCGV